VRDKDTASVVPALSKQVRQLPLQLRRSLTWDRGKEMADHKDFTIAPTCRSTSEIRAAVAARPQRKHQRPVAAILSGYSQSYLNKIALRLNQRPRKTLAFETPADEVRAVFQ